MDAGIGWLPTLIMDNQHYLVFETGGTKLIAGIAGSNARLIDTETLYRGAADQAETSFQRLLDAAQSMRWRHEEQGREFAAIGFGFGGTVDRVARAPHRCLHEEGWESIDVVPRLEARFGLPAAIENDAKLGALAEAHFGAGRGSRTVFYMTVGTGVGGGIVRDGCIQQFGEIGEAEIGHVVVDPEGPPCWCGGRGCVESLCSGPGISQLAQIMGERQGRDCLAMSSKQIFEAWEADDEFATRIVETAAEHLATAVAAAINLVCPDVFVVGGGVGSGNRRFLDLMRERAMRRVVIYFRDRCRIVASELGEQVVPQGAAVLAAQAAAAPKEAWRNGAT